MLGKGRAFCAFAAVFAVCAAGLHAAPLRYGFALAPSPSASPEQREEAFSAARGRVLAAAKSFEGVPYVFGGTTRSGMDCSGFVYRSFREALGVSLPRTSEGMFLWSERIQRREIQPGDLVFFRTGRTARITHVGIYAGGGRFIHSASQGRATGVIFSSLSEGYWARAYAGSGRALPKAGAGGAQGAASAPGAADPSAAAPGSAAPGSVPAAADGRERRFFFRRRAGAEAGQGEGRMLVGFAAAPTWNAIIPEAGAFRGMAGQLRLGAEVSPLGQPMIFGLELRPEWDGLLGVFRAPLTLSWGLSDRLRFFAGPAVSFGSPAISANGQTRRYSGGTSWLGAAGVTAAPLAIRVAGARVSPYGELAWQSYSSDGSESAGSAADVAAGLRFSTGLRLTWRR